MVIDAYGRFKPCSHISSISEQDDMAAYWQHSPDLSQLRKAEEVLAGECQSCQWLYHCRGCRAICEKVQGNSLSGEKGCPAYQQRGS